MGSGGRGMQGGGVAGRSVVRVDMLTRFAKTPITAPTAAATFVKAFCLEKGLTSEAVVKEEAAADGGAQAALPLADGAEDGEGQKAAAVGAQDGAAAITSVTFKAAYESVDRVYPKGGCRE